MTFCDFLKWRWPGTKTLAYWTVFAVRGSEITAGIRSRNFLVVHWLTFDNGAKHVNQIMTLPIRLKHLLRRPLLKISLLHSLSQKITFRKKRLVSWIMMGWIDQITSKIVCSLEDMTNQSDEKIYWNMSSVWNWIWHSFPLAFMKRSPLLENVGRTDKTQLDYWRTHKYGRKNVKEHREQTCVNCHVSLFFHRTLWAFWTINWSLDVLNVTQILL